MVARVRNLYVIGPTGSGKTWFCAALALELKELGWRVAYFKPVGTAAEDKADEDALLFRELLEMDSPPERIAPLSSSPIYLWRYDAAGSHLDRVREAYAEVTRGAEVVIIGGAPSPYHLASLGLDAAGVIRLFRPLVFTVHRVMNDLSLDLALFYQDYLKSLQAEAAGLVLNQVPRPLVDKARGLFCPVLEGRGHRVLGVVPERTEAALPGARDLVELLRAEVLAGEQGLANPVEEVVIGAMTLDSAMRYFRRAPNKALITGGDRTDLALAALETSTSVIVLTGGLYPEARLLSRAEEKGVPVLLTDYDTYVVADLLRFAGRKLRPEDRQGLEEARRDFREHCRHRQIIELIAGWQPEAGGRE
jgi:BioD-like phosphotransacetylase family protein